MGLFLMFAHYILCCIPRREEKKKRFIARLNTQGERVESVMEAFTPS